MSEAAKFQRDGDGWRLYLNDFPEVPSGFEGGPVMPAFTSLSVHFDRGLPLVINRINGGDKKEFWTLGSGHAFIYFGLEQARQIRELLNQLFSAGEPYVPMPTRPDPGITEKRGERPPPWNRFPAKQPKGTP